VKIRAVGVKKFSAIQSRAIVNQRRSKGYLAGVPVSADNTLRQETDFSQFVQDPQFANHLYSVRRHLQSGANLTEGRRSLEQMRFDSTFRKCCGKR
jgi:hypothetical protein